MISSLFVLELKIYRIIQKTYNLDCIELQIQSLQEKYVNNYLISRIKPIDSNKLSFSLYLKSQTVKAILAFLKMTKSNLHITIPTEGLKRLWDFKSSVQDNGEQKDS